MQKQPVYASVESRIGKKFRCSTQQWKVLQQSRFKLFSVIPITVFFLAALHQEVVLQWPLFVGNFPSPEMAFYTD